MTRKLDRAEFFPVRNGQVWKYYIKDRIREIPKVVRAMYQRATRGWADCDVWNIDSWFLTVVPDMLRKLSKDRCGYPIALEHLGDDLGPKVWRQILDQMADDFEALERQEELWFRDGGLYDTSNRGLEQSRQCYLDEMEATRIVSRGLFEFYVWFFSLWD